MKTLKLNDMIYISCGQKCICGDNYNEYNLNITACKQQCCYQELQTHYLWENNYLGCNSMELMTKRFLNEYNLI